MNVAAHSTQERELTTLDGLSRHTRTVAARCDFSMLQRDLRDLHDEIQNYLDAPRSDAEVKAILQADGCSIVRTALVDLNATMHQCTENALARRYLDSPKQSDPFEDSWITKGFSSLLHEQVDRWRQLGLFRAGLDDRIVIVGGGALPQTQIALHQELGCEVVSLERNSASAHLCRAVLAKAGYEHLPVMECDGLDYDYEGAYLVVIATLVGQKTLIAGRVARTSTAILAPRTPVRLHQMWREPVVESELATQGWCLLDRYEPEGASVAALTFSRGPAFAG